MKTQHLTGFSIFVGGTYVGVATELALPAIKVGTVDKKMPGMSADTVLSTGKLEKMESTIKINTYNAAIVYDLLKKESFDTPVIARGNLREDDKDVAAKYTLQGLWTSIESKELSAEGNVELTIKGVPNKYIKEIDGAELINVDAEGMILMLNGVDQFAQVRTNIGR